MGYRRFISLFYLWIRLAVEIAVIPARLIAGLPRIRTIGKVLEEEKGLAWSKLSRVWSGINKVPGQITGGNTETPGFLDDDFISSIRRKYLRLKKIK